MTYTRIQRLGAGNFGEVWLERDDALDRLVAAKYLQRGTGPATMDVFDEARLMHLGRHDHVVEVFSAGLEAGVPVIRMRYLSRRSVHDAYGRGALPVDRAVRVIEDAARGVEALHGRGLLHRDIKPANLLVADNERVQVSDFGLACIAAQADTSTPVAYQVHLPPEALVVGGQGFITDEQGDQYALAVTAYRLINGDDLAFDGLTDIGQLLALAAKGRWPGRDNWRPYVHASLMRAVKRGMHRDPLKRFDSVTDFRHAIELARPAVSWVSDPNTPNAWSGGSTRDDTRWHAELVTRSRSTDFVIQRARAGRAARRVGGDCVSFDDAQEAMKHARTVLARVAASGA